MVSRGVDEQEPGRVERLAPEQWGTEVVEYVRGNLGGTDVLGYATSLPVHYRGPGVGAQSPDVIKERGLAVVHVT